MPFVLRVLVEIVGGEPFERAEVGKLFAQRLDSLLDKRNTQRERSLRISHDRLQPVQRAIQPRWILVGYRPLGQVSGLGNA